LLALSALPAQQTAKRPCWRPRQTQDGSAPLAANGFSAERLARIDRFMQSYVDENKVAGAVGLVLRNGRVVYEKAVGWSDMEAGRRMTPDALFRIASQTKAITSVAIMALVEEGKIAISDPVSRFIPAYSRTMVATRTDTGVAIVPAKRAITIRDLLTHTAGICTAPTPMSPNCTKRKGLAPPLIPDGTRPTRTNLCETMERLASLPLLRSRVRRGSTVTTPTSSAAWSRRRRGWRSTPSLPSASPGR
jgi:CubicO group peptidase (beta-lactamase class C family)